MVAHVVGELGDAELAARGRAAARAVPRLLGRVRRRRVDAGAGRLLGRRCSSSCRTAPADAVASFELALERSMRMRARPYVARSRAGLAEALRRRAGPGDAARAEELSALAAADARELGMVRLQRELGLSAAPE